MNIVFWCVMGPIVTAGSFGLTSFLWNAIGVGLPGRQRRLSVASPVEGVLSPPPNRLSAPASLAPVKATTWDVAAAPRYAVHEISPRGRGGEWRGRHRHLS